MSIRRWKRATVRGVAACLLLLGVHLQEAPTVAPDGIGTDQMTAPVVAAGPTAPPDVRPENHQNGRWSVDPGAAFPVAFGGLLSSHQRVSATAVPASLPLLASAGRGRPSVPRAPPVSS